MALIDDLLNDVADPQLRRRLQVEVGAIRREKKFGLVFEQHLPELVPIYTARIRSGARVSRRNGGIDRTFTVQNIIDGVAVCQPDPGGPPESIPLNDLVAVKRFGEPIFPVLRSVEVINTAEPKRPHHLLIEAENYHALQLLEWLYPARIDCIYIDPPYNTGASDWKYNNRYVDAADAWRHSKWLAFMRRRLVIARRLLKPDGVLIVTIDEHEVHHLGMLLEDLFRDYLHHMITIVINPKGTGKLNFARVDEYALFCVPDLGTGVISSAPTGVAAADADDDGGSSDDDEDLPEETTEAQDARDLPFPESERDLWELRHARRRGGESSYRQQRPNQFYPLWIDPKRLKVIRAGAALPLDQSPRFEAEEGLVPLWPIDAEGNHRCWRLIPTSMQQLINERRVVLGRYNAERNTWTINLWVRKAQQRRPRTVWWEPRHDAGTHGTSLLNKVLGRRDAFSFPKSVYAVRDCIGAVVRDRPQAIILDFFAGSGTTLHATALLNAADGGQRQCILVTNNELAERQARGLRHAGAQSGSEQWEAHGLCRSVTVPRCRAILTGRREDGREVDGEWFTGRLVRKPVTRTVRALSFADPERLVDAKARRSLATALGVVQANLAEADRWYVATPETRDPIKDQAVLFDLQSLDGFIGALTEEGQHCRVIHLVTSEDRHFTHARHRLLEALPPLLDVVEEARPAAAGFPESLAYFRLDYVDPDALEVGAHFSDLLPTLWVLAGSLGPLPKAPEADKFLFPAGTRFGVLLNEASFRRFNDEVRARPDTAWVFLVTDSREAFVEMAEQLPSFVQPRQRIHLYRSYLDNFQINVRPLDA